MNFKQFLTEGKIEKLTSEYDHLPLECDGMTRVLHYVLEKANIKHKVMYGTIWLGKKMFEPHFWIELQDKRIVDYRARMWMGEKAAHGVFKLKDHPLMKYKGRAIQMDVNDMIFKILTLR